MSIEIMFLNDDIFKVLQIVAVVEKARNKPEAA